MLYKGCFLELMALLLQLFFFFLWNANFFDHFQVLLLMGGFGVWDSLPERGKSVVS